MDIHTIWLDVPEGMTRNWGTPCPLCGGLRREFVDDFEGIKFYGCERKCWADTRTTVREA